MTDDDLIRRVAAAMWKAEAVDAGTPQSVADGRTPEAFDDQSDYIRARWTKFARAAITALPARGVGEQAAYVRGMEAALDMIRSMKASEGVVIGRDLICTALEMAVTKNRAALEPATTDAARVREAAMQELIDAYSDIIDYGPLVLAKKDQWARVKAAKEKLK
jgi:hypothetical protein